MKTAGKLLPLVRRQGFKKKNWSTGYSGLQNRTLENTSQDSGPASFHTFTTHCCLKHKNELIYSRGFPFMTQAYSLNFRSSCGEDIGSIFKIHYERVNLTSLSNQLWLLPAEFHNYDIVEKANCFSDNTFCSSITKTHLYNADPLKPHFYTVKLGFTGVYIIFLISAQNIDCGYSLELPWRGGSNEYPQSIFWAEIWKRSEFFIWKFSVFWGEIFYIFE